MARVTVDGATHELLRGATVLQQLRAAGRDVPTLCHDERLAPFGGCRLCIVEVEGRPRPLTACDTPVADGMSIRTTSASLEAQRATLLRLLAREHPRDAIERQPDKALHRLLRAYGLADAAQGKRDPALLDAAHPYIHVDMSQCIDCYRCVRICEEVQGQFVWGAFGRGDRTRIAPRTAPTLRASECVSCGACVDTCPSGALEDLAVLERGEPTRWMRTTCPYCGVGCEMSAGTRGDRLVAIRPVLDAPVNRGHLCVKGRYAFDFVHAADRVTEPMIRDRGGWRTAGWDEAIARVAAELLRIRAAHGPDAIGVLGSARATNEDNYLVQKLARVVLGTHNVDCCARVCHGPTAAAMKTMLGTGAATNSFDDVERARAILVCGANPTENHPVVGARIKQAALDGARLIVIDPRRIELAAYAQVHLAPRPGTNIPLLNALGHALIEEGLVDEPFLAERVDGWPELRAFLGDWTPERAAAICGVDAADIRRAARIYGGEKPALAIHGLGVTEHTQGTEGVEALVNLALLTGNVGKPGSGVNPLRGQNNVQGSAHMGCEPAHLTGYQPIEAARARFESVWGAPLPASPGRNLMQMMDAAARGELRALWAIGYDILLTNPNAAATHAALAEVELLVVQDLFLNETAREHAHVFLPACSSFEKDGTFMNAERRVQRVRAALEPIGGSRPDWQIVQEVGRAMGAESGFSFRSPAEIWEEIRRVWPAGAGITYARLEVAGLQWPCPDESHPGTTVLHQGSFAGGARAPLQRIDYRPTPETADTEFPFLLVTGRSLYQFNAGTMTMRTPNVVLRPADTLDMAPADADRLRLAEGDRVVVRSRRAATELPLHIDASVAEGTLFATFHTVEAFVNEVTSPYRDAVVDTPEYKVTAVAVDASVPSST
jgi:formate dehydrogenase major subunit